MRRASPAHAGTDHRHQAQLTAWFNAITERWIGGCRREPLDRTLIWNQTYLRRVLRQYEIPPQSAPAPPFPARRRPV